MINEIINYLLKLLNINIENAYDRGFIVVFYEYIAENGLKLILIITILYLLHNLIKRFLIYLILFILIVFISGRTDFKNKILNNKIKLTDNKKDIIVVK